MIIINQTHGIFGIMTWHQYCHMHFISLVPHQYRIEIDCFTDCVACRIVEPARPVQGVIYHDHTTLLRMQGMHI